MKYLSSVNLLIMVPRFPGLKHETILSFYAQTEFVCSFSNANLLKEVYMYYIFCSNASLDS